MQMIRRLKCAVPGGLAAAGVILLSGSIVSGAAHAVQSYVSLVATACGGPRPSCSLCHTSPPALNATGQAFAASGHDPATICPPSTPTCTDSDGDGYAVEGGSCGQVDCDDSNPAVHPGATEVCTNRIDDNCNNRIDAQDPSAVGCPPPTTCTDADADGYAVEGGSCGPVDCNDGAAAVSPATAEDCTNGIDDNCDGRVDDADPACAACVPTRRVEKRGACGDGRDNDCDGQIDCADPSCTSSKRCRTARDDDDDGHHEGRSQERRRGRDDD